MKTMKLLFWMMCSLWSVAALGQVQLPMSSENFKPLKDWSSQQLQKQLDQEIAKHPQWARLAREKRLSIGLVDLKDPDSPRFADVNGDHMMYAASLPKIAVLLAAMDALDKRELPEDSEIRRDMRQMISKSSNGAATRLIDRLGYEKIECVMTDPEYRLYDYGKGGGLWVGKRYGGGGGTNRDPIKNLSHAATATQVSRFYYMMAYGKLVNRRRSAQMLHIMEKPELHHKFVNTLNSIDPETRIFRKSGTWRSYHSDSALVWGEDPNRRYILVALIDDPNGEQIARELVRPMENILHPQSLVAR